MILPFSCEECQSRCSWLCAQDKLARCTALLARTERGRAFHHRFDYSSAFVIALRAKDKTTKIFEIEKSA
jgi:hypothetical protein